MDLYNVLDKLRQIENPTDDQAQAIKSAEAMTKEAAVQGKTATNATGTQTYKEYGADTTPQDVGALAGIKPIATIKESKQLVLEDKDTARDFALNITDHILNQYDEGGLGDIVVAGTVLKGIDDTIDNADFDMHKNEKKEMALAITKVIRDEFGDGKGSFDIPKDGEGYSFELQDAIADYIMKAGKMEELPAESVAESDIDMMADIGKKASKINKMKMDLVDGGMEPEDAHDKACEKHGVDPDDYDKYLDMKSSIKTEGGVKSAMMGAEDKIGEYMDDDGQPTMSDAEIIADLESKKAAATDTDAIEFGYAIDMIKKGEHKNMGEAHCNSKKKKTEDADPVADNDPKYADDMNLDKPMSKQEKGDQEYVDNYDKNKKLADLNDELGEIEAMIAGTSDKGEQRTYNYIAQDIRDMIARLEAGKEITDDGGEDFIKKIKPQEGKDMKELKIMDDLTAKFEAELKSEPKETVAESTETKKETIKEGYAVTMDVNDEGNRSVQVSAANESADELLDLLNLSGLKSKGYEEVTAEDLANSPDEKIQTDVDAQWNGGAGGLAKPNHVSAMKSNSNALHQALATVDESVTEEKLMDAYKEYKPEDK